MQAVGNKASLDMHTTSCQHGIVTVMLYYKMTFQVWEISGEVRKKKKIYIIPATSG